MKLIYRISQKPKIWKKVTGLESLAYLGKQGASAPTMPDGEESDASSDKTTDLLLDAQDHKASFLLHD